uniref:Uncharacterized protein n=1 Tax=Glossina morsitans morsitans TaxID=37546 RepID=A0A1B0GBA8_GLOMM
MNNEVKMMKMEEIILAPQKGNKTENQWLYNVYTGDSQSETMLRVNEKDSAALAAAYPIGFFEVSVAEYTPTLYKAFEKPIADSRARPQKQIRKFSVSKMLGTLIGNTSYSQQKTIVINHGTVVSCQKCELHKSRVLKRRQRIYSNY